MIIAIDFDGTCVVHEYPYVGDDVPGAVDVLKELVAAGHQLVLFTMRHDKGLEDAVGWFKQNDIPLWGINTNPEQRSWTGSPKAYAHIYIDDAALGCPLTNFTEEQLFGRIARWDKIGSQGRDFVDWVKVRQLLFEKGALIAPIYSPRLTPDLNPV